MDFLRYIVYKFVCISFFECLFVDMCLFNNKTLCIEILVSWLYIFLLGGVFWYVILN